MYAVRKTFYWVMIVALIAWTVAVGGSFAQGAWLTHAIAPEVARIAGLPSESATEITGVVTWVSGFVHLLLWATVTAAIAALALLLRPTTPPPARAARRLRPAPRTAPKLDVD